MVEERGFWLLDRRNNTVWNVGIMTKTLRMIQWLQGYWNGVFHWNGVFDLGVFTQFDDSGGVETNLTHPRLEKGTEKGMEQEMEFVLERKTRTYYNLLLDGEIQFLDRWDNTGPARLPETN
jgi:hypothetical protein